MSKYRQEQAGHLVAQLEERIIPRLDRDPANVGLTLDFRKGHSPLGRRAKRVIARLIRLSHEPERQDDRYRPLEELRDLAEANEFYNPQGASAVRDEIRTILVLRQLAGNINATTTAGVQRIYSTTTALAGVRCERCERELGFGVPAVRMGQAYYHVECWDA